MSIKRSKINKYKEEREFGFLFFFALLVGSMYSIYIGSNYTILISSLSSLMLLLTLLSPSVLKYPNIVWRKIGVILGLIISPIVIGIIFFVVVWPTGLAMRLAGKDPLLLRNQRKRSSYWIDRDDSQPSFREQY
ncbi:SxtJ family membrane protein [Phyllobacterium phragmitis]|uniref:SxtJ family membrane protein n=1 Tax=Phyllobacterium phragmitis TaxID=2670329 RepID=UPI0011B21351|nr:SxtJ family membrane protein [Phyllobacterium phragmitis]